MEVELYKYTEDPIATIAYAAKDCYDSNPETKEGQKAIVKHCLKSGHHSMMEYAWFHFRVTEVSRAYTHQQVRKRIASYAQRSQRYVNEDGFDFITPDSIKDNDVIYNKYTQLMRDIKELYRLMLKEEIPKEDARFILPNATDSVINVGMNFRALLDFGYERLCSRAQWEIRQVASLMTFKVEQVCPTLGKYMLPKCARYGRCPEKDGCGFIDTVECNPYEWE